VSRASYQVRAYNIKHNYDARDFLEAYRLVLQRAIDEVWSRIRLVEKYKGGRRKLVPVLPKESSFKHHYLRNLLLADWEYSKHYVDSAIKQAYSILHSWRRSYLKGERGRRKPVVKRRFVRIKERLYSFKDGRIKVSIKPYKSYLTFDVSKAWFLSRARGEMGELILNERYLTITFRFRERRTETDGKMAWDSNEKSLDGFNPETGWIRVDLTGLFHIHRVYELKRKRLQTLASRKPKLREILRKYSKRERNKAKDFCHKLSTQLSRMFKGHIHGFERLDKKRMANNSKKHNRNIAKSNWKMIYMFMSYKAKVIALNPKNSTKRCSRCGMINAPKGALYVCAHCGLRINRQLNAAINLYLQMEGLPPSPKLFQELMKGWSGFTQTGEEADEGFNELERSPRLMNPQSYTCPSKTT
jgi:putative transposase